MRILATCSAIFGLTGCPSPQPIDGQPTATVGLFPFDGQRTWEFINTDVDLPYKLVATMAAESEDFGAKKGYNIAYAKLCVQPDPGCVTGEVTRSLQWSSDGTEGVFIHKSEWQGSETVMDPPVQVATDRMDRGDVVETVSDGATWTSTFVGLETCPVRMNVDWPECAHFVVESDAPQGAPIVGEYWANFGFNVVAMELPWDVDRWELSAHSCEGACDGRW